MKADSGRARKPATPGEIAAAILRRHAPRSGLSLRRLYAGRREEFATLLASAALSLAAGTVHSEREVNDILVRWLATAGAMLDTDHVELRRWLVDTGLLDRDGFGRRYVRRSNPVGPCAAMLEALADVDVPRLVSEVRAEAAARREERRARFASSSGPPN